MKQAFIPCVLAAWLAGCSALNHDQIAHYRDHGIPDGLYAKLQAHQKIGVSGVIELSNAHVPASDIMTWLAFTNEEFALTDGGVSRLRRERVSGDVITYMRENPNHSGGLLSTFSPDFYAE